MLKILMVDDDEDDYLLTREHLSEIYSGNVLLQWESSWALGLKAATTEEFDVCLIDHNLGEGSGLGLIQEINRTRPDVLTIMISGAKDRRLDMAAMAAGAIDFVSKDELTSQFLERTLRQALYRKTKERQLREAREEAEKARGVMEMFLANITHELRSPLIGIQGLARELAAEEIDDGHVPRVASDIASNAQYLQDLVGELLEFFRLGSGNVTLESLPFSPAKVIEESVAIIAPRAREKRIELATELKGLDENLLGDPTRLRQVLVNLLSNAVKFTPSGSVTLKARVLQAKPSGRQVRFAVIDTGIGIELDRQAAVFDPFTQADASIQRRFGGTGLGLAITRDLVKVMGGEILLESTPDVGSTFHFDLWFSLPDSSALDRRNENFSHLKVLLADDDEINKILIAKQLKSFGISPQTVSDGRELLEQATQTAFDLILTDINMVGMDGLQAALALVGRADKGPKPVIYACTAHTAPQIHEQCMRVGMAGVLVKPLRMETLAEVLRTLVENSETTTEPPPGL